MNRTASNSITGKHFLKPVKPNGRRAVIFTILKSNRYLKGYLIYIFGNLCALVLVFQFHDSQVIDVITDASNY
jgi:hypothetical protein